MQLLQWLLKPVIAARAVNNSLSPIFGKTNNYSQFLHAWLYGFTTSCELDNRLEYYGFPVPPVNLLAVIST